jgi:hypothetical protein
MARAAALPIPASGESRASRARRRLRDAPICQFQQVVAADEDRADQPERFMAAALSTSRSSVE